MMALRNLVLIALLALPWLACELPRKPSADGDAKKFLEAFENRKKYTSLNEETLKGIKDEDLEVAIIDYIDYKIGDDYKRQHEVVTGLSKGFQAVFTTWVAEGEIGNGGFSQFFWNSTRYFVVEAIDGFYEIGAPKAANMMKRAAAIAWEEFPEWKKKRETGTLEAYKEFEQETMLGDLDEEFWHLDEDHRELRFKYIREHPELFVRD